MVRRLIRPFEGKRKVLEERRKFEVRVEIISFCSLIKRIFLGKKISLLLPATELKAVPPENTTSEGPSLSPLLLAVLPEARRGRGAAVVAVVVGRRRRERRCGERRGDAGDRRSGGLKHSLLVRRRRRRRRADDDGARARPPFDLAPAQEL